MSLPYKKVLILGATSGIGLALAEKFLANKTKVIAVGRRQANLDEFEQKHGKDQVSTYAFDITNLSGIPKFADDILKAHPDLDGLILNSGIQRGFDFANPASIDLDIFTTELTTNYISYVHLLKAFLPHFLSSVSEEKPKAVMLVTSGLAIVPLVRCGPYSASKAALHSLIMTVREQVSRPGLKIIEIAPPAVQTELHHKKHQPDIDNGDKIGMPLDEYIETTWKGLTEGKDEVAVGLGEMAFEKVEKPRKELFQMLIEGMKKGH